VNYPFKHNSRRQTPKDFESFSAIIVILPTTYRTVSASPLSKWTSQPGARMWAAPVAAGLVAMVARQSESCPALSNMALLSLRFYTCAFSLKLSRNLPFSQQG